MGLSGSESTTPPNPGSPRPGLACAPGLFLAGALAGMSSTVVLHPFLVFKTVQQANRIPAAEVAQELMRREGFRGWYRAAHVGLLRNALQIGTYFAVYDEMKALIPGPTGGALGFAANMVAGGVAGGVCWTAVMPLVATFSRLAGPAPGKRRVTSMVTVMRAMYGESGVRGLFRGMGPAMLRAVPANAILLPVFDRVRVWVDGALPQ
mmetsp:Transcript_9845/g.21410  ORF Transcript_9845/g.21410 Transcript_9845/m.21410 type:complete len:207 (+) Transcript_9845:219-839(+)